MSPEADREASKKICRPIATMSAAEPAPAAANTGSAATTSVQKTPLWADEKVAILATDAPAPLRELPVRLERMIHFVPPHLDKLRAKVAEVARQGDVVLGHLAD